MKSIFFYSYHHERDLLMSKEEVKVPFTFVFGGREKDFASSLISLIFYNKDPLFFWSYLTTVMMITELGILDNVFSSDRLLCIKRVVDLKKINKIKTKTISEVLQRPSIQKVNVYV